MIMQLLTSAWPGASGGCCGWCQRPGGRLVVNISPHALAKALHFGLALTSGYLHAKCHRDVFMVMGRFVDETKFWEHTPYLDYDQVPHAW